MFKKIKHFLEAQSNIRYIALGFLLVIFLGSGLLMTPIAIKPGINLRYIDALYTSTSAVCVTGLVTIDIYDTFTIFGQVIVLLLIQIGGLGVTTLGAGLILAIRRRVSLKERNIIQESLNVDDAKGLIQLFRRVFIYTFTIELIGACLAMISFYKYFSGGDLVWKSIFHSVAAFNNSGFDIMGGFKNLQGFKTDIFLNLLTCVLIILGGLGFLVISDVISHKGRFKKFTLQSKVVLIMTSILLLSGMFLVKITEQGNISWLGAFFSSTTARTAGFSTYDFGKFSNAGLIVIIILMFIGASPGSTGGGIKTTTAFVIFVGIRSMITHKSPNTFKYRLTNETVKKAMVVTFLALGLVLFGTFLMCIFERNNNVRFIDALFEMTSAYATVGLTTGITTKITLASKILSIITMYIGRVGPLTIVSLWYTGKDEYFQYAEGVIPVG